MEDVHRAIHEALLDAGPKQVAHSMGTSHTNLLNRANPNDDSHRLNVEQFLQILVHTNDMRPLRALANEFGFDLVARNRPEPKALLVALGSLSAECGDVGRLIFDATADNHISQHEKAQGEKAIQEAVTALHVLLESLKAA